MKHKTNVILLLTLLVRYIFHFPGTTLILGYLGVTAIASYVYFLTWKKVRRDEIEMRSARLALTPLLTAERDREYVFSHIYHCLHCQRMFLLYIFRSFCFLKSIATNSNCGMTQGIGFRFLFCSCTSGFRVWMGFSLQHIASQAIF